MRLARRLASLSPREWRELLRAQWALVRAQVRLRTRPRGGLLDRWSAGTTSVDAEPAHLGRAREIGDAVRRVALYGVTRPQCLARSLAICELLEREHMAGAIVRIGVRPQDSALTAHAWVEFAGEIIGDSRAHVRGYQLLATAHGAARH